MASLQTKLHFPLRESPGSPPPRLNKTGSDDVSETVTTSTVDTTIFDARALSPSPNLRDNGFTLVQHSTTVNFDSDSQIRSEYYTEMEALVQRVTGAERVVLFDHTLRKIDAAAQSGPSGFAVASIGGWATASVNRVHVSRQDPCLLHFRFFAAFLACLVSLNTYPAHLSYPPAGLPVSMAA